MSLAELVNEGERYGMPVLAVTAVGKELAKRDARYLGLSAAGSPPRSAPTSSRPTTARTSRRSSRAAPCLSWSRAGRR